MMKSTKSKLERKKKKTHATKTKHHQQHTTYILVGEQLPKFLRFYIFDNVRATATSSETYSGHIYEMTKINMIILLSLFNVYVYCMRLLYSDGKKCKSNKKWINFINNI